jgi:hypothetical protein
MDLPKKDKKGNSYLSYSQIQTFKRSKDDYYEQYILKKPFEGNAYTDFGSKIGEALEKNDFTKFAKREQKVLGNITRLDEFERRVYLRYKEFYLIGFIDTNSNSLDKIIDYKTGGFGKHVNYMYDDYNQLQIYALALRQETGKFVKEATVEFIERSGNAFKGQQLSVAPKEPIIIHQDISETKLKRVYWDTLRTAKEIEEFYSKNK